MHLILVGVEASLQYLRARTPWRENNHGGSARHLSRPSGFPYWTVAVAPHAKTAQDLLFSCGVVPVGGADPQPASWNPYVKDWVRRHQLPGALKFFQEEPSEAQPPYEPPNGDY